ncbi:hypothetical protein [Minwuia sp.]|uniref:hypothetical protein n=1 Tax=Minwuia sp. TaxID=2493630 RepID=UPI003A9112A3
MIRASIALSILLIGLGFQDVVHAAASVGELRRAEERAFQDDVSIGEAMRRTRAEDDERERRLQDNGGGVRNQGGHASGQVANEPSIADLRRADEISIKTETSINKIFPYLLKEQRREMHKFNTANSSLSEEERRKLEKAVRASAKKVVEWALVAAKAGKVTAKGLTNLIEPGKLEDHPLESGDIEKIREFYENEFGNHADIKKIEDEHGLKSRIESGEQFRVILDGVGCYNDDVKIYMGDSSKDFLGNLVCTKIYTVEFLKKYKAWKVSGLNESSNNTEIHEYSNDVGDWHINLWGGGYQFDPLGRVWHDKYFLIGQIKFFGED